MNKYSVMFKNNEKKIRGKKEEQEGLAFAVVEWNNQSEIESPVTHGWSRVRVRRNYGDARASERVGQSAAAASAGFLSLSFSAARPAVH